MRTRPEILPSISYQNIFLGRLWWLGDFTKWNPQYLCGQCVRSFTGIACIIALKNILLGQHVLGKSIIFSVAFLLFYFPALAQTISFSFSSASNNFCAPAIVRFSPVFSTPPLTFYWQLGIAGEESEALSPVFTYQNPGNYRVTLFALFDNQILEVTQTVNIYGPSNFSIISDRSELCKPEQVNFTVNSILPLTGLQWDFGDGSAPQAGNGNQISHNYSDFGSFTAKATAIDSRGCSGNAEAGIIIRRPMAILSDSPQLGCTPITVPFSANVSVLPGDEVVQYLWNFGDGTTANTNIKNISHTYNQPGIYLATLNIITRNGCSNIFNFAPLSFGRESSEIKLISPADSICASESPLFMVEAVKDATEYLWEISDGNSFNTFQPFLTHKFSDFGLFQVKVTPIFNGCFGAADSIKILVRGVIANYRFSNNCNNRALFDFRSTSRGNVNSIFWDFGDGITSTISRPTKQYPITGSFPLLLRVRENASGCEDTITGMIYTARPRLAQVDTFVCRGKNFMLSILDNYPNPTVLMNWSVLGRNINNSSDNTVRVVSTTNGLFTNRVIINNGTGYCRDTLVQPDVVRVSGPFSGFSIPNTICIGDEMPISNQSKAGSPVDFLVKWSWDFGNGLITNKQFPEPVNYLSVGNYPVSQTVEDNNGCLDSTSQTARVRRLPFLRVSPLNRRVCFGSEVQLTALHRSLVQWSPANLVSCDTCSQVRVKPEAPTTYTVIATDNFGCSRTQNVTLGIWYPFDIEPNNFRDTAICIGNSVPVDLKTSGTFVSWTPNQGLSNPTVSNPIITPLVTTTYLATVTDSGQCFVRTASATIRVNPLPQVDMGPDLILPYNSTFTLAPNYGPDITGYRWIPDDLLSCNNCPTPSGRIKEVTTFTLIATTSQGCSQSFRINLSIECSEKNLLMPSGFSPNNDGLNDIFYPISRGMRMIKRFVIYNRYGEIIHENRNFTPNDKRYGWDGKFRGKLQPLGSYIYFIEAECDLGNIINKKGTITILK